MATQIRYFDYGSRIRSKNSAEPFALINGIGPVFGFNSVSLGDNNKIIISSTNKLETTQPKSIYISDENGNIKVPNHLFINTDGIIAALYGDIELDKPQSSNSEYMVIANHPYIETSELENSAIISIIPNNADTKFGDIVELDGTTIKTWYDTVKTWDPSFNRANSVILAFISVSDTNKIKVYNPYNNSWPTGSISGGSSISGIDTILEYSGEGSSDVSVLPLKNISIRGFKSGSRNEPVIYHELYSIKQGGSSPKIDLRILKLSKNLWSLKGIITEILNLETTPDIPTINAESTSAGKDQYNTLLTYYTASLSGLGLKIPNYKKLFNLRDSEILTLVTRNCSVESYYNLLPISSNVSSTISNDISGLTMNLGVALDPVASFALVHRDLASPWVINIYFDITVSKKSS